MAEKLFERYAGLMKEVEKSEIMAKYYESIGLVWYGSASNSRLAGDFDSAMKKFNIGESYMGISEQELRKTHKSLQGLVKLGRRVSSLSHTRSDELKKFDEVIEKMETKIKSLDQRISELLVLKNIEYSIHSLVMTAKR